MNTRDNAALRLNGYRTDEQGRILCRAGVTPRSFDPNSWRSADTGAERFAESWLVVIAFDVARESKNAREIIDVLVTGADSPRALVGRTRSGSAVVLFKCPPQLSGANRSEILGTRDGAVKFTFEVKSEGTSIDVAAYDWAKRSPLEVEHSRLPTYTPDVAALAAQAAEAAGLIPWELVERAREDEANAAKYANARIPTAQEEREAEEERLVDAHAGEYISAFDGGHAAEILRVRRVVAARRAARGEAA